MINILYSTGIRNYLFSSFARLFFIFFIILFFISSIIILIGIASVTFVIKISFLDLLYLYIYALPSSLFFIIPVTFFITAVLTLSKLSYDYELLVLFSLGISPNVIVRVFLPITILISITLLVGSLAIVPLSSSAYRNFIDKKRSSIDVNIKSGEFGQKLGDWLIYVDDVNNSVYKNLVLFSSKGLEFESFVLSKEGKAINSNNIFEISLFDGIAYFTEGNDIKKIVFDNMIVRNKLGEPSLRGYDLYNYWKSIFENHRQATKLSQSILISLFPIVSIFLLPLFGISNPRFQKNLSYVYIGVALFIFYTFTYIISTYLPFIGILIFLPLWAYLSFFIYKKFILRFY